jgi:hypothetical protein
MRGQLKLQHLSLNPGEIRAAVVIGVGLPAKDNVIHAVHRSGRRRQTVGRGIGHHIGAHNQIEFPPGEDLAQNRQISRIGKVYRNVVGKR